jgi:ferredoxin
MRPTDDIVEPPGTDAGPIDLAPLRKASALRRPWPSDPEPPGDIGPDAPPVPPPAPVRGNGFFLRIERMLAWLDSRVGRWLPTELNPLANAGAAANLALVVAVVTGVLMLLWYSPSVQFAYASLEAIQGRTLGGWVRALHRYSSDLAMLLLVVHAGRVFFARKFSGARWLPWVSGVAMLATVWFIGWTGFWLVWDQPAQQVAVSSMRLLDVLPIFGEPLGRLYVSDRTVPSLLFFVVFFLHMLLPLAIAVGLAVHLMRVSRARLLPRRGLSLALIGGLALAAILVPAPLDAPAQMAVRAESFTVDAWYLSPLALGLRFQEAGLWVALFGGTLLAAVVPWLLGRRRAPETYQAVVNTARCHGCTQCFQDCPFDAITMVPRTDGKRFSSEAVVDPARCVGCGVCAGSCDSEAMTITWFDTRVQEARLEREIVAAIARERPAWVAFVAADLGGGVALRDPAPLKHQLSGYSVHVVPTASWVRPRFVERLMAGGVRGVLVVRDAMGERAARDGGTWVADRFTGNRTPVFRPERAGGDAWCVVDYDSARPHELARAAAEFCATRKGGVRGNRPSRRATIAATVLMTALVTALTVAPSHLQVSNPASSEPEFVFSFKALGEMAERAALDPAAEAAKPVHMRGRSTEKPQRAPVVVRLTIDGVTGERTFAAKGVSRDGPAIGEWRLPLARGEHAIVIEVLAGPATAPERWEGTLRAEPRRLVVVSYDHRDGFMVE